MVNKSIIAQRREEYGNNFPLLSILFNNYMKTDIFTPENVAMLMALMKVSRLANSPSHEDSLVDMENYIWIAQNYQEYLSMEVVDKKTIDFSNEDW